jgi:hypothetical protein
MGVALGAYRRYRELLPTGASGRLTEVIDEKWIENCVGLTGWTVGLDIATANFAAGMRGAAAKGLETGKAWRPVNPSS